MKKRKWLPILLGALTLSTVGLASCGDKTESAPEQPADPPVSSFEQGDTITDMRDVEFTYDADGTVVTYKYTGKLYEVKFLLGDETTAFIELSGQKPEDMKIVGHRGAVLKLSVKDIEDKVKINGIGITVTGIGDNAFYGCNSIVEADMTKSKLALSFDIGKNAFYGCSSLRTVKLPDKVYAAGNVIGDSAFCGCGSLSSIEIGDKYSVIGKSAFMHCSALGSIALPDAVSIISDSAFYMCESLTTVTGAASLRSIQANAFGGTAITSIALTGYEHLVYIGEGAFYGTHLSTVAVPSSVTYIGDEAFYNIDTLTSVTAPFIGNTYTSQAPFASIYGYDSPNITNRDITVYIDSTPEIYADAFNGMSDAKSITISKFTVDGRYNVYSEDGVQFSRQIVKSAKRIGDNAFRSCKKMSVLSIPAGTEKLGAGAFCDCNSMTTFMIPDEVNEISEDAFRNCYSLEAITLPAGVRKIDDGAFYGCRAIRTITIPSGVTEVGSGILGDCESLQTLTISKLQGSKPAAGAPGRVWYSLIPEHGYGISEWFTSGSDERASDKLYETRLSPYGMGTVYAPVSLTTINVGGIYKLPDNMFYDLQKLVNTRITYSSIGDLPNELQSTASHAIGEFAYANCYELDTVTIPATVESIGQSAFYGCRKITELRIPQSVKRVGRYILADCISLSSLTIDMLDRVAAGIDGEGFNVNEYSSYGSLNDMFSGTSEYRQSLSPDQLESSAMYLSNSTGVNVYLPVSLKTVTISSLCKLPVSAFDGWTQLTTVSLSFCSESLISTDRADRKTYHSQDIGASAFGNCVALNQLIVTNGDKVKSIGDGAFSACSQITGSVLGKFPNIIRLGSRALSYSNYDGVITLPRLLSDIGENVFYECPNITGITISDYNLSLSAGYRGVVERLFGASGTGSGSYIIAHSTYVPEKLRSVTLKNVNMLADYALDRMRGLETVTIEPLAGTNVAIGSYSLTYMDRLTTLDFTIPHTYLNDTSGILSGDTSLRSLRVAVGSSSTQVAYLGQLFTTSTVTNNSAYLPASVEQVNIVTNTLDSYIPSCLLSGANNVKRVIFDGATLRGIGANAFTGCGAIATVVPVTISISGMPVMFRYNTLNGWVVYSEGSSVYAPSDVFGFIDGLTTGGTVYYHGTAASWPQLRTGNNVFRSVYVPVPGSPNNEWINIL